MVDKAARTRKIVEEFVFLLFRGESMLPVLHFFQPSPPCRSVLLLSRMLNIEFDEKIINVLEGDQLKPEYIEVSSKSNINKLVNKTKKTKNVCSFQLNPQHTIPTLEDHGLVLWER